MIWELEPGRLSFSRSRERTLTNTIERLQSTRRAESVAGPIENGFTVAGPGDSLYIRVAWCCDQKMMSSHPVFAEELL